MKFKHTNRWERWVILVHKACFWLGAGTFLFGTFWGSFEHQYERGLFNMVIGIFAMLVGGGRRP
jgi:hypothetical protein